MPFAHGSNTPAVRENFWAKMFFFSLILDKKISATPKLTTLWQRFKFRFLRSKMGKWNESDINDEKYFPRGDFRSSNDVIEIRFIVAS
jgi:hypothetical protein